MKSFGKGAAIFAAWMLVQPIAAFSFQSQTVNGFTHLESSSTLKYKNYKMLMAVADDASAFVAGQDATLMLKSVIAEVRQDLAQDLGSAAAAKLTDQDVALLIIEKIQQIQAQN